MIMCFNHFICSLFSFVWWKIWLLNKEIRQTPVCLLIKSFLHPQPPFSLISRTRLTIARKEDDGWIEREEIIMFIRTIHYKCIYIYIRIGYVKCENTRFICIRLYENMFWIKNKIKLQQCQRLVNKYGWHLIHVYVHISLYKI